MKPSFPKRGLAAVAVAISVSALLSIGAVSALFFALYRYCPEMLTDQLTCIEGPGCESYCGPYGMQLWHLSPWLALGICLVIIILVSRWCWRKFRSAGQE